MPEIANYLFWHDLTVHLLDTDGVHVHDGPEANTTVTVEAFELADLSMNYTVVGPATLCDAAASGTLALVDGSATFGHAVCGIYAAMAIKFSAFSAARNASFSSWTIPFATDGASDGAHTRRPESGATTLTGSPDFSPSDSVAASLPDCTSSQPALLPTPRLRSRGRASAGPWHGVLL